MTKEQVRKKIVAYKKTVWWLKTVEWMDGEMDKMYDELIQNGEII